MKRITKRAAVLAAAFAVAAGGGVTAASAQRAAGPDRSPAAKAGDCVAVPGAECGTVRVPLVRSRPDLGTTTVAYAVIRHRDTSRPAAGTLALNPGGPGDSTFAYAAQFAQAYGAALPRHDLLLVEPRGVGASDAAHCGLSLPPPATRDGFVRAIGACGDELGDRRRAYTSAEIADDIDTVRAAVGVQRLDLLGESYGTYLMTVYAQRHPDHVRSAVLSSAYPLAFDLWARPNARAARRALHLLCDAGACDATKVERDISRLAAKLHKNPVEYTLGEESGDERGDKSGGERRLLDDTSLASIVYNATGAAPEGLGDVPAMVRNGLRGDKDMLIAAARTVVPMSGSSRREDDEPFNVAHAAAVMCNDYPTLWDRKAPVATRLRQYAAKRAALPESTFWPFGKRAWTSAINDQGDACIRWPDRDAPAQPTGGPFPDVPVLVVSGAMDANTPTESGRRAARQFRRATVIEVPNVGHVAEKEPSGCAAGIEAAFIRDLRPGDTSCLADIPRIPVT